MIILAGIAAALFLLAREDRRWETQKKWHKQLRQSVQSNEQQLENVKDVLATHDERAEDFMERVKQVETQ